MSLRSKHIPIYQVDAFADQVFEGNPAAVVPLGEWLPDQVMQAIAMENQLSETAFFVPAGEATELRWFTPVSEVDLCGHATLAAAHVLFEELGKAEDVVRFLTRSGKLVVEKTDDGYCMDFPADEITPCSSESVSSALGSPVEETYRGKDDFLAVLASQEAVEALE